MSFRVEGQKKWQSRILDMATKRLISLILIYFAMLLWVSSCQMPPRRGFRSVPTPYKVNEPKPKITSSTAKKSCVLILGAGMTDEVFYAAGWVSYFLKSHNVSFVDKWIGSGFGTYLLVLLSKSNSPHWIEFQLSKLAALDDLLASHESWFFRSKLRSFLFEHFSNLEQTLESQSFAQRTVQNGEPLKNLIIPVIEKRIFKLSDNHSTSSSKITPEEPKAERHVFNISANKVPIKMIPSWLFHPHVSLFTPDPISPSLYSEQEVQNASHTVLWTPISSDANLISTIPDDGKSIVFYFPAWTSLLKHPIYGKGVQAHLNKGQHEFQNEYKNNTVHVMTPQKISQRGFSAHRQLFIQGRSDASDSYVSVCK
jgi:hypothetical protein